MRWSFPFSRDITLTGYPYDKKKTTAVLTLINEDSGYRLNNVIWIHKRIAKMKSEMSLDEFLELTYNITINGGKVGWKYWLLYRWKW